MWHRERIGAVKEALRTIGREIDPEIVMRRARDEKLRLPVTSADVSAPSLGGTVVRAYKLDEARLGEFKATVDRWLGMKAAA